jgi:Lon protease-like protein
MSLEDFSTSVDHFCGSVRLFPLPNLVVFPHVMQPLHIFEPRYREMFEEAIDTDGLIAMAVLAPGWEKDYEGRPPLLPTACLCRVATYCRTEEGTYNVLLTGARRIVVHHELPPRKLFREAEATIIEDIYPKENAEQRPLLQRRLVRAFRRVLPKLSAAQEQLEQLLSSKISLGMLTDIIAYTMNCDQKIKEELLAQPMPDLRALLLLECLNAAADASESDVFPPSFSTN